jgi:ABC-type Na+ efflux pump permease subunit
MNLRKIWVVAVREYRTSVKSKAFIISLVAMPLLMGGGIVAQLLLKDTVDVAPRKVAVVDRTGKLFEAIAVAAKTRNEQEAIVGDGKGGKQTQPMYVVERVEPAPIGEPPHSTLALSNRVRNQELFAFVEIGAEALSPSPPDGASGKIAYHSNSPTFDDLHQWVSGVLNGEIRQLRLREAGLDPAVVQKATQGVAIHRMGLASAATDEGGTEHISEAERVNEAAGFLAPFGCLMLMFLAVFVGASPLLQSVLEEKMARIAEVLLGSVTPFELIMGKLLGTVGVSLTMVSVYLAGAYWALHHYGYAELFPTHLLVWFVVFMSLAVLMYGSLFSAIGAAVTDLKEAQSAMMPVILLAMLPMFVWLNVIRSPTATFAQLLSLFPPATPMLMLMRQAVPPGVPVWEPIVGVILVLVTTVVCVFAAGRVFRVGILMQGKGANVMQMLKWAIHG